MRDDFPCIGNGACCHDSPEHSRGGAWGGHVPFAQWCVERLQPKVVVELGVYCGCSFFAFCHAAKRAAPGAMLIGVDTWKGDPHSGIYGENVWEVVSKIRAEQYPSCVLRRMTFDEAAREVDGPIDLLHIDGFHTYDAVKHDFDTWIPKVAQGGVVLLHDTQVTWAEFGVGKLLAELRREYAVFEFTHGFGLGVVTRRTCVPPPLPELFGADAEGQAAIRAYFEGGCK